MSAASAVATIERKRDGHELAPSEIRDFIQGVVSGDIPDYQASALLMAIFLKGMTLGETVALTEAMLASGERYDLSGIAGTKVDKHSTGGVGDKISLILAPLAAACGLKVPMMSGRGLGHSGGTLDKLESIQGFDVQVSRDRFFNLLSTNGCAMIGQSATMVPADKKLYALRDVTGTVECIPLIVASILSKKIAEGSQAIVFDVKTGSGAFMKSRDQARRLARALTTVAGKMGIRTRALITDMNQPLGCATGNALEVRESIEVLRGSNRGDAKPSAVGCSSADVRELSIQLTAHMLELSGEVKSIAEARKAASRELSNGSAWKKFKEIVIAQGGSLEQIEHLSAAGRAARNYCGRLKDWLPDPDSHGQIGRILVDWARPPRDVGPWDPAVGLVFYETRVKTEGAIPSSNCMLPTPKFR